MTIITSLRYQPVNIEEGVISHALRHQIIPRYMKEQLYEIMQSEALQWRKTNGKLIDGNSTIDYSVARTQVNEYSKYTDYIEHCMRIALIGKQKHSEKMVSGLIHLPGCIIIENGSNHQAAFLNSLCAYKQIIKILDSSYQVFYGGGAITHVSKKDDEIYYKADKKLQFFVKSYLKREALKLTDVKGEGSELVYINTSNNHITTIQPNTSPNF